MSPGDACLGSGGGGGGGSRQTARTAKAGARRPGGALWVRVLPPQGGGVAHLTTISSCSFPTWTLPPGQPAVALGPQHAVAGAGQGGRQGPGALWSPAQTLLAEPLCRVPPRSAFKPPRCSGSFSAINPFTWARKRCQGSTPAPGTTRAAPVAAGGLGSGHKRLSTPGTRSSLHIPRGTPGKPRAVAPAGRAARGPSRWVPPPHAVPGRRPRWWGNAPRPWARAALGAGRPGCPRTRLAAASSGRWRKLRPSQEAAGCEAAAGD